MGLFGTRCLNLSVLDPDAEERHDGVRIGVWHVLPLHLTKRFAKELKIDMVYLLLLRIMNRNMYKILHSYFRSARAQ